MKSLLAKTRQFLWEIGYSDSIKTSESQDEFLQEEEKFPSDAREAQRESDTETAKTKEEPRDQSFLQPRASAQSLYYDTTLGNKAFSIAEPPSFGPRVPSDKRTMPFFVLSRGTGPPSPAPCQ